MLKLVDVWASYGALAALRGVRFDLPDGAIGALLGANGAGKSSVLHAIAGLLRLSAGSITFRGTPLDGHAPDRLARAGVALVSRERRLLPALTVEDHLRLGEYARPSLAGVREDRARVQRLFPILDARRQQRAGLLSGGEQQMLAIGMALMSRPQLLLLDEPSTGLAPVVTAEIFAAISSIRETGVTVLLAEQQVAQALDIADAGFVLVAGEVQSHGPAAALRAEDTVRSAYLGD